MGLAALLPIPRTYHIHWQVGIGPLFYYIFPVFLPILYFMSSLESSGTDQDHVSCLQGNCPAAFVIALFVAPHLLLLEWIGLPMGPPDTFL